MCGIAGYAGWSRDAAHSRAELGAMCDAIRHRGPDDDGYFVSAGIAMGMRRLSIIDVSGGKQPTANENNTVHVVFNGEIYNHRSLRAKLRPRHTLRSHSDTEVLPHLYEEWGDGLVEQLQGMFAFALWDTRRERLLVARDRLGIKPLYYWQHEGGIAFASELRSLLTLPFFSRELDPASVEAYLAFGYIPDPGAIFAGVRKLPPGHVLSWDRASGARIRQYWSPIRPEVAISDEREAVEELQRLLKAAVGSHLESDVPLGAFLSGGIDSSAVVAEMARQTDHPVRTFSIGFEEPEFDESRHAAQVARALGTAHTELLIRPDADRLVEEIISVFDEPFGDSSALPTLLVCQLARQHVTVALSGDGGDELFAGYTRYSELVRRTELRPAVLRAVLREFATRLPQGAVGRNRLIDFSRTRQGRYTATVAHALAAREGGVLASGREGGAGDLDRLLESHFAAAATRDFVSQMTLVDIATYLPGDILTKVDRTSMAVSLEARVPLLDHSLVEFAVSLPDRLKCRDRVGKWIFREAIRDLVPPEVLAHPKQGFGVPLRRWFRQELRHRLEWLLRHDSVLYEFVDRASVQRLTNEHICGRRDHSHVLWRLLALDLWITALRTNALARPTSLSAIAAEHTKLAQAV